MPLYKVKVPFFKSGRYISRNSKVEFTESYARKVKRQLGADSLELVKPRKLKADVQKKPKGTIKNKPKTKN